jgi:hypothetical protein
MAVIVSNRIRDQEFGSAVPEEVREILRRAARVALATPIASRGLPPGSRLLKVYAASSRGPRRIVYLLAVEAGDLFLLFYRDKSDAVGANVSPKNPVFSGQLKKHLALLHEDIKSNAFEVIAVNAPSA